MVSGSGPAPGIDGFDHSASVGPPPSSGIFLGLSIATISAPLPDNTDCNSVGALAEDDSAARILSIDNTASAAGGVLASADTLDFRDDL